MPCGGRWGGGAAVIRARLPLQRAVAKSRLAIGQFRERRGRGVSGFARGKCSLAPADRGERAQGEKIASAAVDAVRHALKSNTRFAQDAASETWTQGA